MSKIHVCQCFLCVNVTCVSMFHVCQCFMCVNVTYVSMFPVCQCFLCVNVTCVSMFHVCQCLICVSMFPVCQCYMCVYVSCVSMCQVWLGVPGAHIPLPPNQAGHEAQLLPVLLPDVPAVHHPALSHHWPNVLHTTG